MNFKDLQDEVLATRFDESQRPRVKRWLNLRYQWLWNQADWNFKHVPASDFVITGGSATPTMPGDFARVGELYDDQGTPLGYLKPSDWDEYNLPPNQASNVRSSYFTVIDRQIYLYPTPSAATYKLSYKRRLSHVDASVGVIGGIFVEDGDQPLWPAEHDYVLVVDAVILGQQMSQDPTWTMLVEQRDQLLASMKRDLVVEQAEQFEQWGDFWSPC